MTEIKRRKSRNIFMGILTLLLFSFVLFAVLDRSQEESRPPTIHVLMNDAVRKEAAIGTYEWTSGDRSVVADADHPAMFTYEEKNTLEASKGQKVYMSISDEQGYLPIDVVHFEVYAKGSTEKIKDASYSINGDTLVLHVEEDSGDYVYCLLMDYGQRGHADYGINIIVDQQSFSVEELKELETPYVGNHGKVGEILSKLPSPGSGYVQRYLALKTGTEPYGIVAYYEPVEEMAGTIVFPSENPVNNIYENMEKNAAALFCLIDNAGMVTFKVRQTPSTGELKDREYESAVTFTREKLTLKYGELEDILDHEDIFSEKP
ncbi:DUF4825 domain-containing protein [Proteiniclasticum sp. C24MP]|uniref:DUF4825 domain-containing protein n=1 Tax=Proteiniclasticum sp. C24MP TaxID=3374101 RepID=UPI003754B320